MTTPILDDVRALARSSPWLWRTLTFTLAYDDPDANDPPRLRAMVRRPQGLRVESRLGQELTPAYDAERLVASARVTRRFGERWSGSAGWAMSWSAVGDVGDEADRLLDDPECVRLMTEFVAARPDLWNEDVGE